MMAAEIGHNAAALVRIADLRGLRKLARFDQPARLFGYNDRFGVVFIAERLE
jgi:hypothetical protein